ncbi:MAG: hypothetical protein A2Z21_07910 [Candidatus Fraserbacteria bacterium RBG_16_55_9]|uniref:Rieske domain-containing protein n=1 Tax=Fraserbacteria sp. (strain RBG_16_55_9) TaxID=1817864 RepID=A0A1F5UQC4_FRAXR|nr:MAG: hypothetical protein A2Z21_07910 [Candidatus Fraserbacteria bacterium RBG_16_55_9]
MNSPTVPGGAGHDRRGFLRRLLTGSLWVGLLSLLGGMMAFIFPPARQAFNPGRLSLRVGSVRDFAVGQGKQVLFDGRPVWVLYLPQGFVALSAVCTHQGCIVTWDEKRHLLNCPCHAGVFDASGNVVAGLPLRPLPRWRVEIVGDEVFIGKEG